MVRGLLNIICKSLDSNYRLTTINLDSEVSEDVISAVGAKSLMKEIDSKLLRNREIERTVNGFKNSFLKGPYQKQYLPGKLPTVKLKQILKLSLPAIPRDSVEQLYHQAKEAAKRETEKVTLQKQGICEFISKECVRLQETMNSYAVSLGFVESSIEKIRALRALSTLVITYEVNEPESLAEKVSQWQEKNRQLIDRQRNKIDVFFRPNHKTLTRKLMEEINQILEVGKAMHLAKP